MTNSISTIFTMDIYRPANPNKSQQHYVKVGRMVTLVSLVIALFMAEPLLGKFDQAFQYIQEFTGVFTPGIVVIFLLGMFWTKATSMGALSAAIGSAIFSFGLRVLQPELPFMDRMSYVFILCLGLMVIVSLMNRTSSSSSDTSVSLNDVSFVTERSFNIAATGVVIILTALYTLWW